MGNEFPYFKCWAKDFLGDNRVNSMSAEELGVYWRLLLISWQEEPVASLPPDEGLLARMARVDTARWLACRDVVLSCFRKGRDGRWHQKRLREEYEEILALSLKRKNAGATGARARWQSHAIAKDLPSVCHDSSGYDSTNPHPEGLGVQGEGEQRGRGPPPAPEVNLDPVTAHPVAKRLAERYAEIVTIRHGRRAGAHSVRTITDLLLAGHTPEALENCMRGYAAHCKANNAEIPMGATRFFESGGEWECWLDWQPPRVETADEKAERAEVEREKRRLAREAAKKVPTVKEISKRINDDK